MDGTRRRVQTQTTDAGEIVLCHRTGPAGHDHYEVVMNGAFLFSTYNRDSERALAQLAVERFLDRDTPLSIAIAGLGTGYTLQAALEYDTVERVTVIEKEPVVVHWARTYFAPYNANALSDQRVSIVVQDLLAFTRTSHEAYDIFCIDVDNGPHWVVWDGNRTLYEPANLKRIRGLLLPGGCATIWSSRRSEELEKTLAELFSSFSIHPVRPVELGKRSEYVVYRASP